MGTASGAPRSDDVKGPTFPKKKWPVCQKRTTPVNGASSKMYRVKYLKASPWFAARQVLGTAPTVSRVGAPQVLGVSPVFVSGSVRLDRGPIFPRLNQPRLGLVLQSDSGVRSGAAPLLLSCPSSPQTPT